MTLAAGYSAAEDAVGAAGSINAAALVSAVAGPIEIIDDIARGSYRMLKTPQTPPVARKTALATVRQGDDLPARAQRAAADTKIAATASRARLRKHAEAVLHEIGCDLAWMALSPNEQDAMSGSLGAAKLVRTHGDRVAGSTAEAITNAARRELADLFPASVGNTIELVQYGREVRGKATELFGTDETLVAELQEPIQIDGATYAKALVYYARACLRPSR